VYEGFLGEHQHIVDDKGRIVMPAKYRPRLERGVVVTRGRDRCLHVYPLDHFEAQVADFVSGTRNDFNTRTYARTLYGGAVDQGLDAQGRLMVPSSLRAHAGLVRDVVLVGVGPYLEIWDAAAWAAESARAAAAFMQTETTTGSREEER
jgi:MraZ protein